MSSTQLRRPRATGSQPEFLWRTVIRHLTIGAARSVGPALVVLVERFTR
jgi:hypothetical protein